MYTLKVKFLVNYTTSDPESPKGGHTGLVEHNMEFKGETEAIAFLWLQAFTRSWHLDGFIKIPDGRILMYNCLIGIEYT